jgi:Ion channel
MGIVGFVISVALILVTLGEGFEAMVLPRQVMRPYRYTRLYYRLLWQFWRLLALRITAGKWRASFLGVFGPLSLLGLFASWVAGLIVGFALLNWSLGTTLQPGETAPDFLTYLYYSGTTFFTLGYGDVTPAAAGGRGLAVAEAGIGFGFMALIIGYMPVLYQAFSRREVTISLLDARAGSPPSAGEALLRLARSGNMAAVNGLLAEWERWSAELLESHLSFPVLIYYRSQHDNQSWLTAVTAFLDTCALLLAGVPGHNPHQVQLTFAMARHAVVDLALVLHTPARAPDGDRLPGASLEVLRKQLQEAGLELAAGALVEAKLTELRGMYEPFVTALARHLLFTLPAIMPAESTADNWQRSAWMPKTPGIGKLGMTAGEAHFD